MKYVIFLFVCWLFAGQVSSQKLNNTVSKKEIVADLSIASIKLENAPIVKPSTIQNSPNGTQQQSSSNSVPSNPPVKCTITIKVDYNNADGIYVRAYIPFDSQVLNKPAGAEIKTLGPNERYSSVSRTYLWMPVGNLTAGSTSAFEFTFSKSLKYNNTVIARVDSNVLEENTGNNTTKAGIN